MVSDNLDFPNIPWSNVPKQVVFFNRFDNREVYQQLYYKLRCTFFLQDEFAGKAYYGQAFLRFILWQIRNAALIATITCYERHVSYYETL